jgi:hypothetical protein
MVRWQSPLILATLSHPRRRRLFYLNLPLSAIAIGLVAAFLHVKMPKTTMKEKLAQMDYAFVPVRSS